jgi:Fur family transcriptional regulator, peroxide stress response regulator
VLEHEAIAPAFPLPGGRRLTPQRRLVYQTLAATNSHPDAEQLIAMVRGRDSSVSVATVYNTLRLLVDAGAVLELRGLGPKTRYDANVDEHDHFTCRICAIVEDIPRQWPVPARLLGAGLRGYRVDEVTAHLRGVCAACRRQSPGGPPSSPPPARRHI